ncbi:hypothetical protein AY606_08270 [Acinetobacter sp. SFB]|nr:hypothetical protein AY606_08270 [Acinetobacter sp. SFB]
MQKFDGNIKNIPTLTAEKLTQQLIPARFIPETSEHLKDKNVEYIFDRSDLFNLNYDELIETVNKARMTGPRMIPVLGTVN